MTERPRNRPLIVQQTEEQLLEDGGELEADFTDQAEMHDPTAASGGDSDSPDDPVSSGDAVYAPPIDPVLTTNADGSAQILGGFGSGEEVQVEPSSDGRPGDEALADAVRQRLAEDSATTDLTIVVAVRKGVAHLRGQVTDLDDADNAEAIAASVPGIREVVDEIDVTSI